MAALTRSGARKASEIVMLIFRALQFSRLAMLSAFAVGSAMSSPSKRRPRAIAATNLARVSERIGAPVPDGRRRVEEFPAVALSAFSATGPLECLVARQDG